MDKRCVEGGRRGGGGVKGMILGRVVGKEEERLWRWKKRC